MPAIVARDPSSEVCARTPLKFFRTAPVRIATFAARSVPGAVALTEKCAPLTRSDSSPRLTSTSAFRSV